MVSIEKSNKITTLFMGRKELDYATDFEERNYLNFVCCVWRCFKTDEQNVFEGEER